jgi:hypothetical protein
MTELEDKSVGGSGWNVQADILAQLRTGATKNAIIESYVATGMPRSAAIQLVDDAYGVYLDEQERGRFREQSGPAILLPAILGGILAAIVSGMLWGGIAIAIHRKLGIAAIAVGALCGYAVVLSARGRRGALLQGIAVFSGMLGILVGKCVITLHFLRLAIAQDYGPEAAAQISPWSPKLIQFFVHHANSMLTLYDSVFLILAMVAAWKIPSESDVVG